MKIEFDNYEEYEEARKDLSKYHNCLKCRGKIILIYGDVLGNEHCGYCDAIVEYPRLTRKAFEKKLKEVENASM